MTDMSDPIPECRIPLPERLDMSTAADLHSALMTRLGEPLVLEAGAVRTMGALALQVLLAAARSWRANDRALRLESPSPQFLDSLSMAGLTLADLEHPSPELPQ